MLKSREDLPRSEDVLTISFLDVLSCGFGAAIYLFLVFSIMPHSGTQTGASQGYSRRQPVSDSAGINALQELAKFAVIEIEVVLNDRHAFILPTDPWNNSLPNSAEKLEQVSSKDGSSLLLSAHIESGKTIDRLVRFHLEPPPLSASPNETLHVEVNLFIGGTRITKSTDIKCAQITSASDVFTIDLTKPQEQMIKWG
jgi:hypothetical protein